jgi:hypothetical protein
VLCYGGVAPGMVGDGDGTDICARAGSARLGRDLFFS